MRHDLPALQRGLGGVYRWGVGSIDVDAAEYVSRCERISIELVPEIAELSRQVLDKLGLGSAIEVVCGDETALADLEYDG